MKGRRDLLPGIQRRKPPGDKQSKSTTLQPEYAALEVGAYGGLQAEVDGLRRDKILLMDEVIRLRQANQHVEEDLRLLKERMDFSEQRQQQMMAFLAQALQHPQLLQHFVASSSGIKRLEDGRRRKKRRGKTEQDDFSGDEEMNESAMVVHNGSQANTAKMFADLADAFTQMLTTKLPYSSTSAHRTRRSSFNGPIVEESTSDKADVAFPPPSAWEQGGGMTENDHGPGMELSPVLVSNPSDMNHYSPFQPQGTNGLVSHYAEDWDANKLPSLSLDEFDLEKLPEMLPSTELVMTDNDLANFNGAWDNAGENK